MKIALTEMGGFQEILERRAVELVQVLRKRDGIAIEKSADQRPYHGRRVVFSVRRPPIGTGRREWNLPAKVSAMRRERAKL